MTNEENITESYKLTVAARNFHYDNFSKWMTYYYVAVAAIFVAFYSIKTEDLSTKIILSALGFITSVLWHLACKGYYFWIKHWIQQIKRFEDEIDEKLKVYTIFSKSVKETQNNLFNPIQSANISTSKITLFLSFVISFAWSYLLVKMIIDLFWKCSVCFCGILIISCILTYVSIIVIGLFTSSNLNGHNIVKP